MNKDAMMVKGLATKLSNNRKTGPMAAIYREVGATCPSSCPLLNNGCYAQRGRAAFHAKRGGTKTFSFAELIESMPTNTVRLNVTGDFLTPDGTPDITYLEALKAAAKKNPRVTFYGYTHAWRILADYVKDMPKNVTILASVNSKDEGQEAEALGWRYARVTDKPDLTNGKEVYCPVDKAKKNKAKPTTTCIRCRMCFDDTPQHIVFFKV